MRIDYGLSHIDTLTELNFSDLWALYQFAEALINDAENNLKEYDTKAERKAAKEYIWKWRLLKNGVAHAVNNKSFGNTNNA